MLFCMSSHIATVLSLGCYKAVALFAVFFSTFLAMTQELFLITLATEKKNKNKPKSYSIHF